MTARTMIALLLAAAGTGCTVENVSSVRITDACFPPTPNDDGTCSYPAATCDAVMIGSLWVDTTYGPSEGTLVWPFQVNNDRPDNSSREGAVNTAYASVTGYKISYSSSVVSIPDVAFPSPTQRTVESLGSTIVSIPVIPPSVATLLTGLSSTPAVPLIRADVRATGAFGDGQTFETGAFQVVVQVRNGLGAGAACVDPATPTLVAVCPQPGQTGIPLCK